MGFSFIVHCYLLAIKWGTENQFRCMDFDTGSLIRQATAYQKFQPLKWMLQVNQEIIRHALHLMIQSIAFAICNVVYSLFLASMPGLVLWRKWIFIKWLNRCKNSLNAVLMSDSCKSKRIRISSIRSSGNWERQVAQKFYFQITKKGNFSTELFVPFSEGENERILVIL